MEKSFFWKVALNVCNFNQKKLYFFLPLRIKIAHTMPEWQQKRNKKIKLM